MKKPQNLNPLQPRPHTVNKDERRSIDNQLPGAAPASDAAHFGMIRKHVTLSLDFFELVERRTGIILRYVVNGMTTVSLRPR